MSSGLGQWFKGLKGRLLFAAVLPLIGFGALTAVSMTGLTKFHALLKESQEVIIPNLQQIGQMRQGRNKFGYFGWVAVAMKDDAAEKAAALKQMKTSRDEYAEAYKLYIDAPNLPGEDEIDNKFKPMIEKFIADMDKVIALMSSDDPQKFLEGRTFIASTEYTGDAANSKTFTDAILKMFNDQVKADQTISKETEKFVEDLQIGVSVAATLLIFTAMILLAAKITKAVSQIIFRLGDAGGQVATAVEELNGAGNNLSQSSVEAAASLEETVASLEELSSMVKLNAEHAREAATLSKTSQESAAKGEKQIQNLIASMNQISQSSKKIEEIISVIDDIAFQTNLLALNAAVEAARAGEQGKGFAVVAEAVRALAQRSAAAAKDITSLIHDSVSQIENGSKIADQSGAVLTNIVTAVQKVSDLNNEISQASSEQSNGIQQISSAMNQLDQASQSNAAAAEEIAATSSEVNRLAVTTTNLNSELEALIMGTQAKIVLAQAAAPTKQVATVISNIKKPASRAPQRKTGASQVIPFSDDEPSKDIGSTNGF